MSSLIAKQLMQEKTTQKYFHTKNHKGTNKINHCEMK